MFTFSRVSRTEKIIILVITLLGVAENQWVLRITRRKINTLIFQTLKGKELSPQAEKMIADWCLLSGLEKAPAIASILRHQPADSPFKPFEISPFVVTLDGQNCILCLPETYVACLNRQACRQKNSQTLFNGNNEMAFLIGHEVEHIKRFEKTPLKSSLFLCNTKNTIVWFSLPFIWFAARCCGLGIFATISLELVKRLSLNLYDRRLTIQEELDCDKAAILSGCSGEFNEQAFKGGTTFFKKVIKPIDQSCSNVLGREIYNRNKNYWCEYYTKHPHPKKRIEQLQNLRVKQLNIKH